MKFIRVKEPTNIVSFWYNTQTGMAKESTFIKGKLRVKILGIWWTIKKYHFNVAIK
jgi:hypothetical protein